MNSPLHHNLLDEYEIVLEVSETEAINNYGLLEKIQSQMARQNIQVAIDDFGKGFAGFDRLLRLKPDVVKLDRSLIQDIHKDPVKQGFVKSLTKTAHMTHTKVLAEGVELIEELVYLKTLSVDLVQGFLTHKPQKAEEILKQLKKIKSMNTVA